MVSLLDWQDVNDRTDTASIIRERTTRGLIIHDPRKRDTTANNGCEGVNAAGGRAERDPNESLLCWIRESEILFFRHHAQIVSGIFLSWSAKSENTVSLRSK